MPPHVTAPVMGLIPTVVGGGALGSRSRLKEPSALSQLRARVEAAFALAPVITAGGTASDQERYFQLTADTLGVSRPALEGTIGPPRSIRIGPSRAPAALPLPVDHGGRDYVALLLRRPDLRDTQMSDDELNGGTQT